MVVSTGNYRAVFWIDNSEIYEFQFIVTSNAEINELRNKQYQINQKIREERRSQFVCQHCGGTFKGLFSLKCSSCGKPKDY